ncbi:MAG: DUF2493 domain-containing protein [Candidatus Omnitrophica bacterium]|nr:DUF2493 domain-containing protein [Candidatus Omnitrophota bacterium]
MKILICGDRHWTDETVIAETLFPYAMSYPIIIHGGARGADTMGETIAERFSLRTTSFRAQWSRYGNSAGVIRNREMIKAKPDLVLAFHNDIENSKGTKDMIKIAKEAGIEVRVITSG